MTKGRTTDLGTDVLFSLCTTPARKITARRKVNNANIAPSDVRMYSVRQPPLWPAVFTCVKQMTFRRTTV
jgi:hypothetical protein